MTDSNNKVTFTDYLLYLNFLAEGNSRNKHRTDYFISPDFSPVGGRESMPATAPTVEIVFITPTCVQLVETGITRLALRAAKDTSSSRLRQ